MPENAELLDKRIAQEQSKIQVESFTDIAFEGAWKGRARSFWATAMVGTAFGAAIGAVVPFFPVLAGVSLAAAVSSLTVSIPVYAALGMSSGFGIGVLVGATSGASASVAKEQERREKGKEIEQVLSVSPEASVEQKASEEVKPALTFKERLKYINDNYVNIPAMLTFAAIGALGGGLMFAAFSAAGGAGASFLPVAKPLIEALLPAAASTSAGMAAYTVGVMTSFGAIFGFNAPKMAGDLTRFVGDLLGGKTFGIQKGPESEQVRKPVFSQSYTNLSMPEQAIEPAPEVVQFDSQKSYRDMIAGQMVERNKPQSLSA